MTFTVERVTDLQPAELESLVHESEAEGYRFLTRLVDEYQDQTNTFNQPGEALYVIKDENDKTIAVGGVNLSPFDEEESVGRLQRFYVEQDARRKGAGSLLIKAIADHSKKYFSALTVRTESSKADAFYLANGFEFDDSEADTTHILHLQD